MMLATILTTSILATGALTLGWLCIADIINRRNRTLALARARRNRT